MELKRLINYKIENPKGLVSLAPLDFVFLL